ncbi:MAG: methyltransferase, partial [Psychroflexus sp.]
KALDVAKENASEHKADLNFMKQDILKSDKLPEDTDVIISNPPYVKYDEKGRMRDNVLNYEPHVALFVKDNDALIFYRKICELAIKASQNVTIYFEINQYLANDLKMMLKDFNIQTYEFRQDFRGNDRMLKLLID